MKNYVFLIFVLLSIFINSCKKNDGPTSENEPSVNNPTVPENNYVLPKVTFNAPVKGQILDINGQPVPAAKVIVGVQTTTTDNEGNFQFSSVPFTGNFCYIKAVKTGYFNGSYTINDAAANSYNIQLFMEPIKTFSLEGGKGGTIEIGNGTKVYFPANAIKTLDGKAYSGNVTITATYTNPSDSNFSKRIPGSDLRGYSKKGENVFLHSMGILNLEMKDAAGNLLQLGKEAQANLTLPVAPAMLSNAPATIPLWYFDENKGVWIEEGTAKLNGNTYVGAVSHFTPWGVFIPYPYSKIKGKILDCNGNPLIFTGLTIGQVIVYPNNIGEFEITVANNGYPIVVKDLGFFNPPINYSLTNVLPGTTHNMGTITVPCLTQVSGTLTKCNNKDLYVVIAVQDPSSPLPVYTTYTTSSVPNLITGSSFEIPILASQAGKKATIYFWQTNYSTSSANYYGEKTITLPSLNTSVNIGNISVCTPLKKSFVSFDYTVNGVTKNFFCEDLSGISRIAANNANTFEFYSSFINDYPIINDSADEYRIKLSLANNSMFTVGPTYTKTNNNDYFTTEILRGYKSAPWPSSGQKVVKDAFTSTPNGQFPTSFSLNFTSIDPYKVEGTFTGTFVFTYYAGSFINQTGTRLSTKATITNGKFYVYIDPFL